MGFKNSGQSCNSPSRLLVPEAWHDRTAALARDYAEAIRIGDPQREETQLGPVVSRVQFDRIQSLIQRGIEQGAKLEAGGLGLPPQLDAGYFVRPTVFSNVSPEMDIARIEIFGPVITIIPYRDEDEAIRIANDTVYGLANYVSSGSIERARRVARRLRSGMVHLNAAPGDYDGAFGGYKQSGNGREWGKFGFLDFMEVKSIFGHGAE
jgi:aldehyde dehydrogenase (NAD+)